MLRIAALDPIVAGTGKTPQSPICLSSQYLFLEHDPMDKKHTREMKTPLIIEFIMTEMSLNLQAKD